MHDLVIHELGRGPGDLPVFVGEILRGEYILRLAIFDQETAAGDALRGCGYVACCHC